MRIGENIEALELAMNLTGQSSVIYPTLLWDSYGVTLVDTGTPGQLSATRQQIENAGVDFESIHRVILTHQDIDHIGGLPEITRVRGDEIEVLAHEDDKPYIEGEQPLIIEEGELVGPNASATPDMESANASLRKLTDYDIDRVLCYHGGYFGRGASARIEELSAATNGR